MIQYLEHYLLRGDDAIRFNVIDNAIVLCLQRVEAGQGVGAQFRCKALQDSIVSVGYFSAVRVDSVCELVNRFLACAGLEDDNIFLGHGGKG